MSGSSSRTQTSSSQATNVSELNLQDTGGITVADNAGPTSVSYTENVTDGGAVQAMLGALKAALTANTSVSNNANSEVGTAAVTLGQTAIDSGTDIARAGLDHAQAAYESGLTFGTDALMTVANLFQDSGQREAALVNNALSGYQSIAATNSASDATKFQQIVLYVIVAAVAMVILPKMLD